MRTAYRLVRRPAHRCGEPGRGRGVRSASGDPRILPAGGEADPFIAETFLLEAPGQPQSYIVLRSPEIEWTQPAGELVLYQKPDLVIERIIEMVNGVV